MPSPNDKKEAQRVYNYRPHAHGSATWADKAHLAARGFGEHGDICLGYTLPESDREPSCIVTINSEIHEIISGGTRSGKGVKAVVERCIFHKGQLISIGDKNAQNASIAIKARLAMGRKVVVMGDQDLADTLGLECVGFDSLGMLDDTSHSFFEEASLDAQSIVNESQHGDQHWIDEGLALITALIMYVKVTPKSQLPVPQKGKTMAQVRACLNLSRLAFKQLITGTWEEKKDDTKDDAKKDNQSSKKENDTHLVLVKKGMLQSSHQDVVDAANRLLQKTDKEFSGIVSTAQSNTHWLQSPMYRDMVSKNEFDLRAALLSGDTDIFVLTHINNMKLAKRSLRLFLNKVVQEVMSMPCKPTHKIRVVVDEFLSMIGYLKVIEDQIAFVAGQNLIFTFAVQSLSQLKSHYKESYELFFDNSHLQIIAAFSNFDCDYVSQFIGKTTIELLTESTVAKRAGLAANQDYFTTEDQIIERDLIKPDEVRQNHPAYQIVILQGARPALIYAPPYYVNARFRDKRGQPIFGIDRDHADKPLPKPIDFTKRGLDILKTLEPYVIKGAPS